MGGQRFLDEVRMVMRRLHDSIHTERSYCDWITQFVKFHRMQSRQEVVDAGVPQIEAFLTYLAEQRRVAASTQNQAFNALVFLYRKVLKKDLAGRIDAARATKGPRPPVVLQEHLARTIQALLGHKDVETTMIYTHVLRQGAQGNAVKSRFRNKWCRRNDETANTKAQRAGVCTTCF